jgi:hypothetical protein
METAEIDAMIARGRGIKARKLVLEIDKTLAALGVKEELAYSAGLVAAFGEDEWAEAALSAGVPKASDLTRQMVVNVYAVRAGKVQIVCPKCKASWMSDAGSGPRVSRKCGKCGECGFAWSDP